MKIGALIPARSGSKGIPGKNFRELYLKELWGWTWEAARDSNIFDKIIISTDKDRTFPDSIYSSGTIVDTDRPPKLSDDTASCDEVLCYYKDVFSAIDVWCLLVPTSPLRTAEDIKNAISIFLQYNYDSLVSVNKADYAGDHMYWKKDIGKPNAVASYNYLKRLNRQDIEGQSRENGAIYITKKEILEQHKCRIGGNIGLYEMPRERSFEIDDEIDWQICEMLKGK